MKQSLTPSIEDLRLDYVLIQAWKKTSSYLRSHSWYADTLGIDYESLRLPQFIKEIQNRLKNPDSWESRPIMLVPAPKNQKWNYQGGNWEPQEDNVDNKMRPLAHVDLQDQVVATAIMLCLANRIESAMGNPCLSTEIKENRKKILAYGHRLFCDQNSDENLCHRWGSSKIYRQYYQDYRTFLERPNIVAKSLTSDIKTCDKEYEIAIVQSDLSKFYDRVSPSLLWDKLKKFQLSPEETEFFQLAKRVFKWQWASNKKEAKQSSDTNILRKLVALPQGLVTAGFFANIVMSDFENALRKSLGKNLFGSEIILEDACYYVDDFRFVLRVPKGLSEKTINENVINWVQQLLSLHAKGLRIAEHKTEVTVEERDKQFLVKQSSEADRIQHQVSGPFDMQHGTEIIAAIEGFFRTQQRYSMEYNDSDSGLLIGIPDMRDETAARFAAGKFRKTFRSLRPLLSDEQQLNERKDELNIENDQFLISQLVLTKQQLDERAKLFSAQLIEEWVKNPANVRLLRIALDIYPDKEFLELIVKMLRPGWGTSRGARREVRLYCLAELFRAGATETGIVHENECLPGSLLIDEYHKVLIKEAHMIVNSYLKTRGRRNSRFPWYLMQQIFLYLGSQNAFPETMETHNSTGGNLLARYWDLSRFMTGKVPKDLEQRAILLVLVKTGFGVHGFDNLGIKERLSEDFLIKVNSISPEIAYELWLNFRENASPGLHQTAQRLGFEYAITKADYRILAEVSSGSENPFLDEENLLQLASWLFLKRESVNQITPWKIKFKYGDYAGYQFGKIDGQSFDIIKLNTNTDLFTPPSWCESKEEQQKYQIGLILRYALLGLSTFNSNYNSKKQHYKLRYKRPISHWEQQRYSAVQGRDAFGPAWLPISSFTENLLFELLRWPGSGIMVPFKPVRRLRKLIDQRLNQLLNQRNKETSTLLLEQIAPWPGCEPAGSWKRPLRVGIIQSIIPTFDDYESHKRDPELNDISIRDRQSKHLAAIMVAVENMLRVRETYCKKRNDGRKIDLIIFPELAIHPDDIDRLILPFVLKHKCIALFGQVYHKKDHKKDSPLINSCLWMIPEWSTSKGLQIRYIEQGKKNLTKPEKGLHPRPISFRPAQWLIEYQWNSNKRKRPLVLSASICYDATDLAIAADLRSRSDIYIICALNQDVGTFDRMSDSLHYHMYQGVIVVNNGQYGGSNFFMPHKEAFRRQVFHIHGQPQVSISFVEISPEELIKRPNPKSNWKTPPAGW